MDLLWILGPGMFVKGMEVFECHLKVESNFKNSRFSSPCFFFAVLILDATVELFCQKIAINIK